MSSLYRLQHHCLNAASSAEQLLFPYNERNVVVLLWSNAQETTMIRKNYPPNRYKQLATSTLSLHYNIAG